MSADHHKPFESPAARAAGGVAEVLLLALLLTMPAAFGGAYAWAHLLALSISVLMAVATVFHGVLTGENLSHRPLVVLPVLLFGGVILLQVVPLPIGIATALSRPTVELREELLRDVPHDSTHSTISLYPGGIHRDARVVAICSTVFFVVLQLYSDRKRVKRLLFGITVIGAGIAALALAQHATGTRKIYWQIPVPRAVSGPFVYHNQFSQFMNLVIGAAIALLLLTLAQHDRSYASISERFRQLRGRRWWSVLLAMLLLSFASCAIFLSLSRSGAIGFGCALVTLVFATPVFSGARVPIWRRMSSGLLLLVVLAAGILFLGSSTVHSRVATIFEFSKSYAPRLQLAIDTLSGFRRFMTFGAGFGSFEQVFPMFDTSSAKELATHAENEYAQLLFETGIVGAAIVAMFVVLVGLSLFRSLRSSHSTPRLVAFGLGFGLCAVMVQSLADFGQHCLADACMAAVFCALLLNLPMLHNRRGRVGRMRSSFRARAFAATVWLCVVAALGWAFYDSVDATIAEAKSFRAQSLAETLSEQNWNGADEVYTSMINCANAASRKEPFNVDFAYWHAAHRAQEVNRHIDTAGKLIITSERVQTAREIVQQLNAVRLICPVYGPAVSLLGQIESVILKESRAADEHIRLAARLAPCRVDVVLLAVETEVDNKQWDRSVSLSRQFLRLGGRFASIADLYLQNDRPELAIMLAGENRAQLKYVVSVLQKQYVNKVVQSGYVPVMPATQLADRLQQLQTRLNELLKKQAQERGATADVFAERADLAVKENDTASALNYYTRALALDFGQVDWRMARAQLLAAAGNAAEAKRELRLSLRMQPRIRISENQLNALVEPGGGAKPTALSTQSAHPQNKGPG